MASQQTRPPAMDQEFLPVRAKILEVAASLDRIQRVTPNAEQDPRWSQLHEAIRLLLDPSESGRAEQVQLLFSRSYDENWRDTLSVPTR